MEKVSTSSYARRLAGTCLLLATGALGWAAPVWKFEDFMKAVSSGGALRVQAILQATPSFASAKDPLGNTALHKAATRDVAIVLIDAKADVDARAGFGQTPLWDAASEGRKGAVEALLAAHADPNLVARDGSTPLHRASMFNENEIALLLIGGGAKLDEKDGEGRTPLAAAARNCRSLAVQILVSSGADIRSKDGEGRLPVDLASHCSTAEGKETMTSLLRVASPEPRP